MSEFDLHALISIVNEHDVNFVTIGGVAVGRLGARDGGDGQ